MILATFRAARTGRDELKPRELITGLQCLAWGTLPVDGGYYDQPARLMQRMTSLVNIYQATWGWIHSKSWAEFARSHPDDWSIIQDLILLEKAHGTDL